MDDIRHTNEQHRFSHPFTYLVKFHYALYAFARSSKYVFAYLKKNVSSLYYLLFAGTPMHRILMFV